LLATEEFAVDDDLALIVDAAREAGRIALGFFQKSPEVWMKGGTSPVSEADYAADRYLRETLTAARPAYGWLSEEMAQGAERPLARRTFVVDPIDGTRAFLDGKSTWCVSVAVVEDGRPLAGVLECPAKEELFAAAIGLGATKNGRAVRVAAPRAPALIAGPKAIVDHAADHLGRPVDRVPYIPSLAYRVAMVAEGALDATFIKPHAHDWDIAAAELVLTESGGRLVEPSGKPPLYASDDPRHGLLVAGSGPLLEAMVRAIAAMSPSTV
jgi:myo-inositol-1(or 4)-monophosphatase